MATLTRGQTFTSTDTVTHTKLHALVDSGAVSAIVNADIDASAAIADTKLATISTAGKVDGAALTGLASIPAGAGVIPSANISVTVPVKATGAELNTGTDDAKFATAKAIADSTIIRTGFGAWTAALTNGTSYEATTNGFVMLKASNTGSGAVLTDSSNPPTTERGTISVTPSSIPIQSSLTPIKKGDYYKVREDASAVLGYFIPLG